jgi:mannose-6-phosphate isomerase
MSKTKLHNGNVQVNKPWGQYTDIYRSPSVVFKRIEVFPGEEISYQYHLGRGEFWYIFSGHGSLTIDDTTFDVTTGESFQIDVGLPHQIKNTGDIPITIFEMQFGDCQEEDIVRLNDKYDR